MVWIFEKLFCLFCYFIMLVSLQFPSHSWPCILYKCLHYGFWWSGISYLLSSQHVCFLKSSDMYFEYSKCRTFWEFLIYICGWFLFSLPWQRSVIFSPLQIVLIVKNYPHFLLYNCFVLYSSRYRGVLLFYYCLVDCFRDKKIQISYGNR